MTRDAAAPAAGAAAVDDHLLEHVVQTQMLLQGGFLRVQQDTVRLPDARLATREYILHPGAVAVVPLLDDGRLVMVRQFRHPLGRVMLEFPAGKIDPGEPVFSCAVRELAEETGFRAQEWARACAVHNAAAYSNEAIEIWFARGLAPGPQCLDPGEFLEVCLHSEVELDALAAAGQLTDVKTLIALQWLQKWRAGRWALSWQPAP